MFKEKAKKSEKLYFENFKDAIEELKKISS